MCNICKDVLVFEPKLLFNDVVCMQIDRVSLKIPNDFYKYMESPDYLECCPPLRMLSWKPGDSRRKVTALARAAGAGGKVLISRC